MTDIIKAEYMRSRAVEYIKRWIGTPYIWGGDDFSGFDCSGLILEVLSAFGIVRRGFDTTANGLHDLLAERKCRQPEKGYGGCLVFWYTNHRRMVHVAMMIDNEFMVHSAGGGSNIHSREDAIKYNAYVRIDHIDYRGANYIIVDPFLQEGD